MRLRLWVAGLTLFVSSAVITPAVLLTDVGVASAAPTCALPAPVGGVITLTADCDTTVPLTIPDGVTLNGAGHTITAHDVTPGSFNGAVVTNAGTSMNVENLTIMGTGFTQTQPVGSCGRAALYGIWFNGAGGSVTNVTVTGITEGSNCQVGRAIVGNGTAGQTLTITGTTVSDYNKDAMHAYGMTMNVSDSTIDPPASLKGITGQNGLVYQDGASGTTSDSTIFGSGYGNANNANTAVLLFGATNVTLSGDTITGDGTDIGVAVAANSTGAVIDGNQIGRTAPDVADSFGFGVEVDSPSSTATLTCNTFSGWIETSSGCRHNQSVPAPPTRWLLDDRRGWRGIHLRCGRLPRLPGQPPPHRPRGRDGRHDRRRLLAGGFGRQRVLARRAGSLGRCPVKSSTHPSSAWRRRRTGSATTWWEPTGACSPSATPTFRARWEETPQQTGGRHGCHAGQPGLLLGGL